MAQTIKTSTMALSNWYFFFWKFMAQSLGAKESGREWWQDPDNQDPAIQKEEAERFYKAISLGRNTKIDESRSATDDFRRVYCVWKSTLDKLNKQDHKLFQDQKIGAEEIEEIAYEYGLDLDLNMIDDGYSVWDVTQRV